MTIFYACVDNATGCKSTIQSLTTIPGNCSNLTTPVITATESSCQSGCSVNGGSFNTITDCGIGTTLTYFTDITGTTTASTPTYNQDTHIARHWHHRQYGDADASD
jgi:hypothetical protein